MRRQSFFPIPCSEMVSEEYSKTSYYFWSDCLKFLATIPAILMFSCLWAYYHGNHRAAYINKY